LSYPPPHYHPSKSYLSVPSSSAIVYHHINQRNLYSQHVPITLTMSFLSQDERLQHQFSVLFFPFNQIQLNAYIHHNLLISLKCCMWKWKKSQAFQQQKLCSTSSELQTAHKQYTANLSQLTGQRFLLAADMPKAPVMMNYKCTQKHTVFTSTCSCKRNHSILDYA